jgi:predicted nucleic acid-binding protein
MYLVDTSVWINYLRKNDNPAVQRFEEILNQGIAFGLTGIIYQEILQGAASQEDFNQLVEFVGTQRFYSVADEVTSYQAAAALYFNCRRKGITIRSTVDCLIAQTAIENDLILLHSDADYVRLAGVAEALKLYPSGLAQSVEYKIHER